MAEENIINLELNIHAEYMVDDDVSNLGGNLYSEIHARGDVESVGRVRIDSAPEGTKPGDPITIGTLAVAVLPTAIPSLITLVQGWVERGRGGRTVKFKFNGVEYEGPREDAEKFLAWIESQKKNKKNKKK